MAKLVGMQKNAHQPILPHNIIENFPTPLAHNSVLDGPENFEFGAETCYKVLHTKPKFGGD